MRNCFQILWLLIVGFGVSGLSAEPASLKAEAKAPTAKVQTELYQDLHYKFAGHGYGNQGENTPSFFAFSQTGKKWIRISQVSTRDAVLGRSPEFDKVPLPVGWDHSRLKERDYVEFPLITGCVLLPDKIEYVAEKQVYRLSIGSRYGEHSHPTTFDLRKSDLDAVIEKM